MSKLYVFDIDGTLCSDHFRVGENFVLGIGDTSDTDRAAWLEYLILNNNAYKDCEPIPAMVEYAESLRQAGERVFFMSTDRTSFAYRAKHKWLKKQFPNFHPSFLIVAPQPKGDVIAILAKKYNIPIGDCVLWDDTRSTLVHAAGLGIEVHHVSEMFSGAFQASGKG